MNHSIKINQSNFLLGREDTFDKITSNFSLELREFVNEHKYAFPILNSFLAKVLEDFKLLQQDIEEKMLEEQLMDQGKFDRSGVPVS